jgi:hypothetical protein
MSHTPKQQDRVNTLAQRVFLSLTENIDVLALAQKIADHNETCEDIGDSDRMPTVGAVLASKSFDWAESWWAEHARRNGTDE